MRVLKTSMVIAGISTLMCTTAAVAQNPAPPSFAAVEAYSCDYQEDKDRGDLDKVTAKWNKWMDSSKGAPYSAWIMTPLLTSTNTSLDVVWLGVWANGNDMGKGMQAWADNEDGLAEDFNDVITCGEHSNAASVNIRPPAKGWPGKGGVTSFSDCTVAEGKTMQDAMAAHRAWAAHLDAIGSNVSMWAFFPGAGTNNPEYDYKMVSGYMDLAAYGADWEAYTNGQGWAKAGSIYDGVVSCSSQRVYQTTTIRDGGVKPM